jgi:hypothetical protein
LSKASEEGDEMGSDDDDFSEGEGFLEDEEGETEEDDLAFWCFETGVLSERVFSESLSETE